MYVIILDIGMDNIYNIVISNTQILYITIIYAHYINTK